MDARVIFTKEFIKKTKGETMTPKQRGKILFERLVELDKSGEITKATNRTELARLVGAPEGERGYSWVSNLVNRKHITETIVGRNGGRYLKEYHLAKKRPMYGKRNVKKNKTIVASKPVVKPVVKTAPVITEPTPKTIIKYGKVEIETFNSLSYIVELVRKLNEE